MLSLTLAAALLVSQPSDKAPPPRSDASCAVVAVLAESVMLARQSGVPLARALEAIGDDALAREMALMAWQRRAAHSRSMQQHEINRFRDLWHVQCLSGA
jgi:NhaP-type Na+/H+ or K+/H+ antiporter